MTSLTSLIERIEDATEGSRELDGRIWCCINGYEFLGWDGAGCRYFAKQSGWISGDYIKEWTTSIDAALTLLPEGRAIRREYLPAATWPHRVWIYKDSFMPLDDGSRRPVLGKTEALALCAAALKARAETEAPHEHD